MVAGESGGPFEARIRTVEVEHARVEERQIAMLARLDSMDSKVGRIVDLVEGIKRSESRLYGMIVVTVAILSVAAQWAIRKLGG